MKKLVISALIGVVVLAGLGAWIWSLGSIPAEARDGIILKVEHPQVEVRHGDAGEWTAVTSDTELAESDEVRTGADGRATIRFFDSSETRLRHDSVVTIEEARRQSEQASTTSIKIKLIGGRVWSRVMRLFDLDSSFSVRTDTAVATVRGTAFDLGLDATGTTMWVADSAVAMGNGKRVVVPEGFMAIVDAKGGQGATAPMTDADVTTDWFKGNVTADQAFQRDLKEKIAARLMRRGGARPDSAFDGLVKFSENMHVKTAGSAAPDLYGKYLGRRLFGIKSLIDGGKSGLGLQAFMGIENDVKDILKTANGKTYVPAMRSTISEFMVLLSDVGPSSPLYRLQQRLEDLNLLIAGDDVAAALYARLLAIDSHLSVASNLIGANALEEAGLSLDGATQGIENAERDLNGAALEGNRPELLRGKLDALKAREGAIRIRLQTALVPPPAPPLDDGSATSTSATTSTQSTTPTTPGRPKPPTPGTPVPPVNEAPWDIVTLSAQPNPVFVGSSAQLRVTGSRNDGSTGDLTSRASFVMIGSLGSLNGPTYTATKAGSVTVEATVMDNGVAKKARTTIQVNDAVKLSLIDILPQGSTTVYQGQTVSLVVRATYSSGLTAIVTSKATWGTSDANIGSAANGVFTAWINGQGVVTITATYTEDGVTKSNSIPLTVIVKPPTGLN